MTTPAAITPLAFCSTDQRPVFKPWRVYVHVVSATGLPQHHLLRSNNAYVEVSLEGVFAATSVRPSAAPVWNESVTLYAIRCSHSITFSVFRGGSGGGDFGQSELLLGRCWCALSSLPRGDIVDLDFPLVASGDQRSSVSSRRSTRARQG